MIHKFRSAGEHHHAEHRPICRLWVVRWKFAWLSFIGPFEYILTYVSRRSRLVQMQGKALPVRLNYRSSGKSSGTKRTAHLLYFHERDSKQGDIMALLPMFVSALPLPLPRSSLHPLSRPKATAKATKRNQSATCSVRSQRRRENVPGNVYVDSSCIDCDTCRCK